MQSAFRVGFVLIDGFALMSYASAVEPLRACNLFSGRLLYDIRHLAVSGSVMRSSSGALIPATESDPDEAADLDMVLLVAGSDLSAANDPKLLHWLRLQARRKILIGGVSAGPLLLAQAGVMQGRRMTVHWEHAARLQELNAAVTLERSLFVRDRDRLTCAGGIAALDMMHALIAEQQGPALAEKISEWFLHTTIRPGELAQRVSIADRYRVTDSHLIACIGAMENHLADPLELDQLAILSGCGKRQLNRLFQQELGSSTVRFYRSLRLVKARELLQSTSWSVEQVAEATGFAGAAHLGRCCRQYLCLSPGQIRRLPAARNLPTR